MRVIKVLGSGCADCLKLELAAAKAAQQAGIRADIRKVTDERRVRAYGIVNPPGLVIDGTVASEGRVPSPREIAGWLRAA